MYAVLSPATGSSLLAVVTAMLGALTRSDHPLIFRTPFVCGLIIRMTAPLNDISLIELVESLEQVNTGKAMLSWVREDLGKILRHGAFICGMGRIHRAGVAPVKFFSSNFPADYLPTLKQADGLYRSAAIQRWLASGEVLLLEPAGASGADFDYAWLDHFRASGLQNIAAHGIYDFSRQHASYFSFHQIPERLGERHRGLLKILVPHMHTALLRILHKLKDDASATRIERTLTARELEVLTWVCEGKTSAEIASILGIARSTVRNQIQSTLVKLRVNTRSQAAAKAIRKGLVTSTQPDSQFGRR